jgi:hypothetical protein
LIVLRSLAIVGGGPAALMIYKRLVASGDLNIANGIFEAGDKLGCGMRSATSGILNPTND